MHGDQKSCTRLLVISLISMNNIKTYILKRQVAKVSNKEASEVKIQGGCISLVKVHNLDFLVIKYKIRKRVDIY